MAASHPSAGAAASSQQLCLDLQWVFGLNKDFKGVVHNLSDGTRKAIFYFVGHTAIIYDVTHHTQKLLQGHRNPIVASCVSASRRFLVTADAGEDSVIIVWDSVTSLPVRTLPVHQYGGVLACDISNDASYIVTLSKSTPQTIALWGWTADDCVAPEIIREITAQDEQNCVRFNPDDSSILMTNGAKRVIFWSWAEGRWSFYAPGIASKEVKQVVGNFTQSCFVPGTSIACTGTVDGDVILWDSVRSDKLTKPTDKFLLKVVRTHNGGVTYLGSVGRYIVTGGVEGFVRFFDHQLRIVAWFEELNGGPIISVSFDRSVNADAPSGKEAPPNIGDAASADGGAAPTGADFRAPDFVVSTSNAMIIDVAASSFHSVDTEYQRGKLLVQGQDQPIMSVAAHPSLPRLAVAGYSGSLHLWEYSTKKVLLLSIFRNLLVHCLAFDPKALYLACGFTNGVVKILDANSLEELQSFKPKSPDCITMLTFSHDSQFFATADSEGCVGLYRYTHRAQDPRKPIEWVFVGRHRAHRATITSVQFGIVPYGDAPRLMSLGEDKRLVEYNLVDSDIESGLLVRVAHRLTQGAIPTGGLWTPEQLVEDAAIPRNKDAKTGGTLLDSFLVATNEYKLKVHCSDMTRQTIKTVLGPTFGGPVNRMIVVPAQPGSRNRCLVYSTHEKVVGLVRLPLDGNPRSSMGLLAHPLEISSLCVSHCGQFLFTAGGRDCSMHQWRINGDALQVAHDAPARVTMEHFIDVIEGGREGSFMKEIVDYFYYAQIRAQGEETTAKRKIVGKIPFQQVPDLMRALGYYPSDKEIQNMTLEIATKSANAAAAAGTNAPAKVDDVEIDFDTFIRLYVNHRPVFGISKQNIEAAFKALGADPATGIMDRPTLFATLQQRGEAIHQFEIEECLRALLDDELTLDSLEDRITAKAFAENLLGFEDYEEADASGPQGHESAGAPDVGVSPL